MTYLLCTFLIGFDLVCGSVFIYSQSSNHVFNAGPLKTFNSISPNLESLLPFNGIRGYATIVTPRDGCSKIELPPNNFTNVKNILFPKWIALIPKSNCSFDVKIKNAQDARFIGAIFYSDTFEKDAEAASFDEDICIPSLFIDSSDAQIIIKYYPYSRGFVVTMSDSFYEETILFLFAVALMCFTLLIIKMTLCFINIIGNYRIRCLMNWHVLRKLKITKYQKSANSSESCIICLQDYEEGDSMRILPCKHNFHLKCVDRWLAKNIRCPQCNANLIILVRSLENQ